MAALGAETMIPGHGMPIFGADRVRAGARRTPRELLESLEEQMLALMNQGVTLDTVLHEVKMPEHLLAQAVPAARVRPPAVHPAQHLAAVRRLVRRRARQPAAGAASRAGARVGVAGRRHREGARARDGARRGRGNVRLACHVVEYAVLADPQSKEAHAVCGSRCTPPARRSRRRRWRATSSTTRRSRARRASAIWRAGGSCPVAVLAMRS